MHKDSATELSQLKSGILGVITYLNQGMPHLDRLTCRVIARALDELLQEIENLPRSAPDEDIEQFAKDILAGTEETQAELASRWQDELQPLMWRTQQRAEALDHDLAEFTCLTTDGQKWGAICIKCLEWVIIQPHQASGALLHTCNGWLIGW